MKGLRVRPKHLLVIVGLAVVLAFPYMADRPFLLHMAILTFLYITVASSLNLLHGYTGQISIMHAGLFGVGAYTSTTLTMKPALVGLPVPFPFWVSIWFAGLVTGLIAAGVGVPAFRTRGIYFIIANIAAQLVMSEFYINAYDWTGGESGIRGIPAPEPLVIPGLLNIEFAGAQRAITWYYFAFIFMALVLYVLYVVVKSPLGSTFVAIREDETLATSMGVRLHLYKTLSFFISAFFTGMAGAIFAHYMITIAPYTFDFLASVDLFIMVMLGGAGTFFGPIIGGALLLTVRQILWEYGPYRMVALGALLLVLILFAPRGLAGPIGALARRVGGGIPTSSKPEGR